MVSERQLVETRANHCRELGGCINLVEKPIKKGVEIEMTK